MDVQAFSDGVVMSRRRSQLSWAGSVLVVSVVSVGAAAAAQAFVSVATHGLARPGLVVATTAAFALLQAQPVVTLQRGDRTSTVQLTEAAFVAAVLTLTAPVVVVIVMVGTGVGELLRNRPPAPLKWLFTVCLQCTAAAAAVEVVAAQSAGPLTQHLARGAVAGVVFGVLCAAGTRAAIGVDERQAGWPVERQELFLLAVALGSTAAGVVAALAVASPAARPYLVVAVAMLVGLGRHGHRQAADATRLRDFLDVTDRLARAADADVPAIVATCGRRLARRPVLVTDAAVDGAINIAVHARDEDAHPAMWLSVEPDPESPLSRQDLDALHALATITGEHLARLRLTAELERRALTDPLTGLANRAAFSATLISMLEDDSADPLALVLIDLDGFKAVNDTQGHDAGDELLVEIASLLRRIVPATGLVARLGGDEFAVITHWSDGAQLAQRIETNVAALRPGLIGASVGVARSRVDGDDVAALVHAADQAMYRRKAQRKATRPHRALRPSG
jgi:diguanylate cyclase (GGDEF)-like protein